MSDMSTQDKLLVTADEAAAMLGMGRSTLYTMVKEGRAPAPVKMGALTRWRVADLQQHVQAMQTTRPSTPGAAGFESWAPQRKNPPDPKV